MIFTVLMISTLVGVSTAYAMPNQYHIPDPIDSLKVHFPQVGQSWHEVTVFINTCDAKFNPNCEYGNRRASMEYIPFHLEIHKIDYETKDHIFIESVDSKTGRSGYTAVPIHLDEKYEDKTQYLITVTTESDIKTGKFWTFSKHY